MDRPIRVLVYPNWKEGSVYVTRLDETTCANGVQTEFTQYHGAFFPLSRQYKKGYHDLLHLHWVSELFAAEEPSTIKFWIRYILAHLDIWYLRNFKGAKIVWTIHNLVSHDAIRPKKDIRARRFVAAHADQLILHGPHAEEPVERYYRFPAKNCISLPHGNHKDGFPNECSREEARKKLDLKAEQKVFLFFGSLRRYKGVEELIEAFNQVEGGNLRLLIAGRIKDAEYKTELEGMIDSRTSLSDSFIPVEDVQFYMKASDVVVLPFRQILTSGSLLLAMTFGKMVVAPRMGTLPDYVDPDGGVLYEEEANAVKHALEQALQMDSDAAGKHNAAKADRFDWEPIGKATAELYQYVLGLRKEKPDTKKWWG
jgi:glycosyltransferase involved in cell wall biosynthesis